MKSKIVSKEPKVKKQTYPCLKEHKFSGMVALFYARTKGTVLYAPKRLELIGYLYTSMLPATNPAWVDFTGVVQLSN